MRDRHDHLAGCHPSQSLRGSIVGRYERLQRQLRQRDVQPQTSQEAELLAMRCCRKRGHTVPLETILTYGSPPLLAPPRSVPADCTDHSGGPHQAVPRQVKTVNTAGDLGVLTTILLAF